MQSRSQFYVGESLGVFEGEGILFKRVNLDLGDSRDAILVAQVFFISRCDYGVNDDPLCLDPRFDPEREPPPETAPMPIARW